MAVVKVKTEKDLDALQVGDAIVFDFDLSRFDDLEDGPLVLLESDEWAEIERLTGLIEERFSQPPVDPVEEKLAVSFTDTHAVVTSPVDRTVAVSGDVRDGEWKLSAGKPSKRKLTKEGTGVVIIDGVAYSTPEGSA